MEDEKAFCKRAEELESIDELGLPEEAATYLKELGKTTGEILAAFRSGTSEEWCNDVYLFRGVDETRDCFSDLDNLDKVCETTFYKLEEMGLFRDDLLIANFILVNILGELWIETIWGDEFLEDNDYVAFNKKYEEYVFPYDRIIEILHDGLTKGQFDIIKFMIDHPSMSFHFSNEEKSLREAARINIRRLLKTEIMEIILS